MGDRPIIDSLLDVDFYKDTMGQLIFHKHPRVPVKFAFSNRHRHVALADCIDRDKLRENLEHVRSLRFRIAELDYLLQLQASGTHFFQPDYVEFLRRFQLPDFHLDFSARQLVLEFSGDWACTSRWETFAMQIVSELYAEYQTRQAHSPKSQILWAEGDRRLHEKISMIKGNRKIAFTDFGTRRRFSRMWHEHVISTLAEAFPDKTSTNEPNQFYGTSNSSLAMKYGLTPAGTNGHELPMVYSAIYRNEDEAAHKLVSQLRVLEDWEQEYGLGLSIFLPDTYGSDYFFCELVPAQMASRWKGSRHDSGSPVSYGQKRIEMYQSAGVNPKKKLIIFADSLTVGVMDELERYFRGKIQTAFGIGTNLTNDLGPGPGVNFEPLSIVVKPVEAKGLPVVKLSDNIEKATGDPDEIERVKQFVGYKVKFAEKCRY